MKNSVAIAYKNLISKLFFNNQEYNKILSKLLRLWAFMIRPAANFHGVKVIKVILKCLQRQPLRLNKHCLQ